MKRPPNILLIVIDCARADRWLGAGRFTQTPNLDRLAARGAAFDTVITEKACTTPCFSTLLTGQYSPRHGVEMVWGYRLPEHVPLLTDGLRRRGYRTLARVSGPLLPEMGLARGFDDYQYRAPCDYLHSAWGAQFREELRGLPPHEPWFLMLHLWELHWKRVVPPAFNEPRFGRDSYERAVSHLDQQLGLLLPLVPENTLIAITGDHGEKTTLDSYPPGGAVDYARKLLDIRSDAGVRSDHLAYWGGPSVLQALYGVGAARLRDVRLRERPKAARSDAWSAVKDRTALLFFTPFLFLHDLLSLRSPLRLTRMMQRRGLLDAARSRGKVGGFSRMFGKRRAADLQLRMWMNTYRQHMDEGHMVHVYDCLVRVPLILHGPGVPSGLMSSQMVRQPDLLPTLLELAGAGDALPEFDRRDRALSEPAEQRVARPRPASIDGRSFASLLRGEPWSPTPAYLSVTGIPAELELRGVRTSTHKFSYGPANPELPVELYDLQADPSEQRNLAGSEPGRCAELRALADALACEHTATQAEAPAYDARQQVEIERRLRELGYLG